MRKEKSKMTKIVKKKPVKRENNKTTYRGRQKLREWKEREKEKRKQ